MSATQTVAPPTLPVRADGIPTELTERPQWVCWRWEWRDGKPTKVPVNPRTGHNASPTNPATWSPFADALAYADVHGLAGIGFVVTRGDPYTAIDVDKCRDPETGELEPWAAELVSDFDSYTETTPSGTGIRIWIKGTPPDGQDGRRSGKIEVYRAARYLTVTGHVLNGGQP